MSRTSGRMEIAESIQNSDFQAVANKLYKDTDRKSRDMEEIITIKAYRCAEEPGVIHEIRRRSINRLLLDRADSLKIIHHFLNNLFSDFPKLMEHYSLCWKDDENDLISIQSSAGLMHAQKSQGTDIFKVYLKPVSNIKTDDDKKNKCKKCDEKDSIPEKVLHNRVICDGCEGQVFGYRFKCMDCSDYDLCEACFQVNKHPNHVMVRLIRPDNGQQRENTFMFGPKLPHRGGRCGRRYGGWRRWNHHNGGACGSTKQQEELPKDKKDEEQNSKENDGNMWNEYLRNWGQTVAHLLDQFGVDAMVDLEYPSGEVHRVQKPTKEGDKQETTPKKVKTDGVSDLKVPCASNSPNCAEESSNSVEGACAAPPSSSVEPMTASSEGAKSKTEDVATQSNDVKMESAPEEELLDSVKDWTLLEKNEADAEARSNPIHGHSQAERSAPIAPEVEHCLKLLKEMGFKDDDGGLRELVEFANGDICAVLELIK